MEVGISIVGVWWLKGFVLLFGFGWFWLMRWGDWGLVFRVRGNLGDCECFIVVYGFV